MRWQYMLLGLLAGLGSMSVSATPALWQDVGRQAIPNTGPKVVETRSARTLQLDLEGLRELLEQAPLESEQVLADSPFELALPTPDGGFTRFRVVESPIMAPELAAKFPQLKTYLGQGIDDLSASVRFDLTALGFRAQVLSWDRTQYIEPYQRGDTTHYVVFGKDDLIRRGEPMRCEVTGEVIEERPNFQKRNLAAKVSSGANLRTYRLAMAATGEYTQFLGGTVLDGLSGIVTTMNRVNAIYEREVAVRMVLIANNEAIIYTNPATDPYANTSGDLNANQTNINSVIGSANYDIGHLFGTGGGGVAQLGSVCGSGKARGLTGSGNPVGDAFDVDYVAHEIGHQFNGRHTFNGSGGNCSGGNRSGPAAFEPGSGITIQAYAGICGADNLQPNSEDYFHRFSLNEILAFVDSGGGSTCDVATATGNGVPAVTSPGNFRIPRSTPFQLTASGSDPNGDSLSYLWEQFDLPLTANPAGVISDVDNRPLFRSFDPTPSPTRIFPSLRFILADNASVAPATAPLPGTTSPNWLTAEVLPSTARTMNFTVTVRDNRAGGGGTNEALSQVTVEPAAGPFLVTAPGTAVSWAAGSTQTVTWNVAGTNANGINTSNVEITLSRDGGQTFPIILAASTPNDGTHDVVIPAGTPATTQARIRVAAVGNIYFDISNPDFSITGSNTAPGLTVTGSVTTRQGSPTANANIGTVSDAQTPVGNLSLALSGVPPELSVSAVNNAGTVNLSAQASCSLVTPTSSNKTYPVQLTVTDADGASTTRPVNILVGTNLIPSLGAYTNTSVAQGASTTVVPSAPIADGNNNLVAPTVSPTVLPGSNPATQITVAANGTVTVNTDAGTTPGAREITVRAIDSCGAQRIRRFVVTVTPGANTPTTTTITSDTPDPSVVGQAYTVAVQVTASGITPTGSISVNDGTGGGSASCGPVNLSASGVGVATASCNLTSVTAGARTLTASYTPSGSFVASSGTASHQVNPAVTAISVSGPPRSRINTPVNFSFALSVEAPGAGAPAGTVTLSSGASSCQVNVPTTNPSCALNFNTLGARVVNASFSPSNGNFAASSSSGPGNANTLVFAQTDLSVSKSNGVGGYSTGQSLVYNIVYTNLGPDAAANFRVRDSVPAALGTAIWSCTGAAGGVCPTANGNGSFDLLVPSLVSGGSLNFTLSGTVQGSPASISNTADVQLPADTTLEDPQPGNNSATDTDFLDGLFANGFE